MSIAVLLTRLRHTLRDLAILLLSTVALLVIASRPDHFRAGVPLILSILGLASLAVLGGRLFWCRVASRAMLFGIRCPLCSGIFRLGVAGVARIVRLCQSQFL